MVPGFMVTALLAYDLMQAHHHAHCQRGLLFAALQPVVTQHAGARECSTELHERQNAGLGGYASSTSVHTVRVLMLLTGAGIMSPEF